MFTTPVRDLLALLVNNSQVPADTSWGVHRAATTRGAVVELVRADVGFLRRGEWYTALYFVGGLAALLLLAARDGSTRPGRRC